MTWGSGTIGISGMVSASNSIIGGTFGGFGPIGDEVGSGGVTALLNGNYVVKSPGWSDNTNTGAVTWENGSAAATGTVAAANSLVGGATSSVVALNNGNYVVCSPSWSSNEGAVTWGSGTAGVSGIVSASNSLVGSSRRPGRQWRRDSPAKRRLRDQKPKLEQQPGGGYLGERVGGGHRHRLRIEQPCRLLGRKLGRPGEFGRRDRAPQRQLCRPQPTLEQFQGRGDLGQRQHGDQRHLLPPTASSAPRAAAPATKWARAA